MLSDAGCDQRSIHSLMQLAQLSEIGRQGQGSQADAILDGLHARDVQASHGHHEIPGIGK